MSQVNETGKAKLKKRKWCHRKSGLEKLEVIEANLFGAAGLSRSSQYVPISFENSQIYTVFHRAEVKKAEEPIVLIHGFAGGVAIWSACIQLLAKHHDVYAFDLLGFGRSSRPKFSKDPETCENEMVGAIEEWRTEMEIEKMFLVAHSFGAYLSSLYTLKYPSRVKHLILVEPWGFSENHPASAKDIFPDFYRSFLIVCAFKVNLFSALKLIWKCAPCLVKRSRPDLARIYPGKSEDEIYNYIYYCNSQKPTGEIAFKNLSYLLGWAKRPMSPRFREIDKGIPVTFILGDVKVSWIDNDPIYRLQTDYRVSIVVKVIENAGHHIYADAPKEFGELVCGILETYFTQ